MLKLSPMELVDFNSETVRNAIGTIYPDFVRTRWQASLATMTYWEAFFALLQAFPDQYIYRGGHHIAVHTYDGGPCMFRVVEVFPNG
jgi:hypothetical protein